MNLYIGNLSFKVDKELLRELFEQFGIVKSVKLVVERQEGRKKVYAFVEMQDDTAGQLACDRLNESTLMGRNLVVSKAKNPFYAKMPFRTVEQG
ncbi:RNA recognition motif domain-containing protein [Aureibacter tunicatorum]|uniref:RNA recognition motif-containing protein n=1 Tax=Aureibacter tunicatorum TaxID=866807 RepID=A0AAE3XRB7_9BACT|nr:RNA-binding protein [Aureibacter tunicatorum]MDR6241250.1 RNA recognition motif-containing protein [Aureibacter tunicatorum]BDD03510.1 RNA-binding protein [Aureibacter tunicatorum]